MSTLKAKFEKDLLDAMFKVAHWFNMPLTPSDIDIGVTLFLANDSSLCPYEEIYWRGLDGFKRQCIYACTEAALIYLGRKAVAPKVLIPTIVEFTFYKLESAYDVYFDQVEPMTLEELSEVIQKAAAVEGVPVDNLSVRMRRLPTDVFAAVAHELLLQQAAFIKKHQTQFGVENAKGLPRRLVAEILDCNFLVLLELGIVRLPKTEEQ